MDPWILAAALFLFPLVAVAGDAAPEECRKEQSAYSAYAHPDPDSNLWGWCEEQVGKGRYQDLFSCTELGGKYDFEREMIQAGERLRQCRGKAVSGRQR